MSTSTHQLKITYEDEENICADDCFLSEDGKHNFIQRDDVCSCSICGLVALSPKYADPTDWEISQVRRKSRCRPYYRPDYWHERMRQFKCEEPSIPIPICNAILDQASCEELYGPPESFNRSIFHKVLR